MIDLSQISSRTGSFLKTKKGNPLQVGHFLTWRDLDPARFVLQTRRTMSLVKFENL